MIWEEPHRGAAAPRELSARIGIEQVRAFVDGRVPRPPISRLTGMIPTAVGPGTCEFRMPATGWLATPTGQILGGTLAILADGPLGCAIHTTLPAGTAYTTSEISMSYLRPPVPGGGALVARGRSVHTGRSLALSEVVVQDESGRDLAHGTSRCFVFPPVEVGDPPPALPPVEEPEWDTPDPYEREVLGELTPPEVWEEWTGLEIMRGWIDGELPRPPIHHLTGQMPVAAGEGSARLTIPASGWLASPTGWVEGGVLAMHADAALAGAVQTTVPAGTAYAPVDITVKFIRPVAPDGRDLVATGRVVHRGRSMAVLEGQIHNADGKLVCAAVGSALILAGRRMGGAIAPEEATMEVGT